MTAPRAAQTTASFSKTILQCIKCWCDELSGVSILNWMSHFSNVVCWFWLFDCQNSVQRLLRLFLKIQKCKPEKAPTTGRRSQPQTISICMWNDCGPAHRCRLTIGLSSLNTYWARWRLTKPSWRPQVNSLESAWCGSCTAIKPSTQVSPSNVEQLRKRD